MVDINSTIAIISLTTNGLNGPIKRLEITKKQGSTVIYKALTLNIQTNQD